jgi:DNA-binding beta-propeller fold protein YncE
MMKRLVFSFGGAVAMAMTLWSCTGDPVAPEFVPPNFQLWVTDQGTNMIHVLDGATLQVSKSINIQAETGATKPHMVVMSPDFRYAYVACIGTGHTVVYRVSDYKAVATLATGASTHAAIPNWNGRQIAVAVIGERALKEIIADPEKETFTIGRSLNLAQALPDVANYPDNAPICQMFTYDGASCYVTLRGGGLAVVSSATFQVTKSYPLAQIAKAGCGLVNGPPGTGIMFANSGTLTTGIFYMFETGGHNLVKTMSTGPQGLDAHGVAITPDGRQLWMVNRLSDNLMIFDLQTQSFVQTIPDVGDAPDLIVFSPEGGRAFITLRGMNPATGTHDISGQTPGISVIDVQARKRVQVIPLPGDQNVSDPHGIWLRPVLQ